MSYDNPWTFNGQLFDTDQINKSEGFVYMVINQQTGQKYIGRKYFFEIRKVRGKLRRQRRESNWKSYYGSSERIKADIEEIGREAFLRTILSIHKTRGDCNYAEVREQFSHNVLESEGYYNDNISGKWHNKPLHIIEGRRISNGSIFIT